MTDNKSGFPQISTVEQALIHASEYEATGDYSSMFEALRLGFSIDPLNYELFFSLGFYYLTKNANQAFLCFQNAYYYCLQACANNKAPKEDLIQIQNAIDELTNNSEISVKPTSIVIVAYNSLYLQQMNIKSIRSTLLPDTYNIIVIDNASTDGCAEWLEEQPDITLIKNSENKGFASACNQGSALCKDSDIFLLNNDTRLSHNSLFWLKMGLYESDNIGATGSISNYAGNNQQIELTLPMPNDYTSYGDKNNIPDCSYYEERVRLSGFAMLIKANLWQNIGGMDEAFSPGYFEDDDLSIKLLSNGFKLLLCNNSFIYHAGSQSFASAPNVDSILLSHHAYFQKKYGFDILKLNSIHHNLIAQIPYKYSDAYNILIVGAGLGADAKYISTLYPNANIICFEKNSNAFPILCKHHVAINSIDMLLSSIKSRIFNILLFIPETQSDYSSDELLKVTDLCHHDCLVISSQTVDQSVSLEKIKLIVWDMDDTFWKGTISEGEVCVTPENISLIYNLVDHGIINSISSKNDVNSVMNKLKSLYLDGAFVFNNINWLPKGPQLADKLSKMGLRPENTLFIDDNPRNLEEAKYCCPYIMTATPNIIPKIARYYENLPKTDRSHQRLKQYIELESKVIAKESFSSSTDFLYSSNIKLCEEFNVLNLKSRILELINRTNQLNFTKNRITPDALDNILSSDEYVNACIYVKDNYSDYGIVGFYSYSKVEHRLIHFLFSCRIIGMGIEQFIFSKLGCPQLNVILPVSVSLNNTDSSPWIDYVSVDEYRSYAKTHSSAQAQKKVLLKGPCDLSSIEPFLHGYDLSTEFNYINSLGFVTTGQNHSVHILESQNCSNELISKILSQVPFLTRGDFETEMFTNEYDAVCYSLLQDCAAGLYKHKETGFMLAFGGKNFPLTKSENITGYCSGQITNHNFPFNESIINSFSEEFDFIGCTPIGMIIDNLEKIYSMLLGTPQLIILLGSEIEYEGYCPEFSGYAKWHKEVNQAIKEWAQNKERISLINATDFIRSQTDYLDSTDHYSREVYSKIASKIQEIIDSIPKPQ